MKVTPALRGEGFYIGDQFGFRYFPTSNLYAKEKSPVLILHGFPGWNTKNEDIATALALNGYGSYLIHLPGLGESKGLFDFSSVVEKTKQIAEFICKIHDVSKLPIIGHSFGGFLALAIKEIASSLTLLAPLSNLDKKENIDLVAADFFKRTEGNTVYSNPDELKKVYLEIAEKYPEEMLTRGLSDIPTLLIHGTEDLRIPVSQSRALKESLGEKSSYVELTDDHRFTQTRKNLPSLVKDFLD